MADRPRIVSGMRPSGKLHLGNYHGALLQWVTLQETYDCFYFVADWHALTTDYQEPGAIPESIEEMVIDWLAAGIDPERSTLFVQSHIPEHAELFLLLGMLTPLGWLERNPSFKETLAELAEREINTFGFLGYPVLMCADIIVYKAQAVPVGVDQAPHLELTREIARRFNYLYGSIFPEPQMLLTEVPKLLGVDRRKMSKSYGNAILLSDTPDEVRAKVLTMITDPARVRRTDPGDPDVCNVFSFHKLYSPAEEVAQVDRECRAAARGCVECKQHMAKNLITALAPFRERRAAWEAQRPAVSDILAAGNARARAVAQGTLAEVRRLMKVR